MKEQKITNEVLQTNWGMNFDTCAKNAKHRATEIRNSQLNFAVAVPFVEFEFNGVLCVVSHKTDLKNLLRDYLNAHYMDWKVIGPDCVNKYSDKIQKELDRKLKEAEEEAEQRSRQYKLEAENKRLSVESKINGVEFSCSNPTILKEFENNNTDSYGGRCVSYAKEWAVLMQIEIAKGKSVKDVAETTSREADYDGITGFMYGASVNILSQCWKYGEDLRMWHNKKYNQEGDGVVNPAVMTISK